MAVCKLRMGNVLATATALCMHMQTHLCKCMPVYACTCKPVFVYVQVCVPVHLCVLCVSMFSLYEFVCACMSVHICPHITHHPGKAAPREGLDLEDSDPGLQDSGPSALVLFESGGAPMPSPLLNLTLCLWLRRPAGRP